MPRILLFSFILIISACGSSSRLFSKKDIDYLIGKWDVLAFRFHDGRVMPAEYMGYPYYEFTSDGKRIKRLKEQPSPPPEVITYAIKADSIWYPDKPTFPAMKVEKFKNDTLVLTNHTLSWYLLRSKP